MSEHPAHISLDPKCTHCRWVRTKIEREAVDAFIEKELPGLLRKTFSTIYWTDEFLAAKIKELRDGRKPK